MWIALLVFGCAGRQAEDGELSRERLSAPIAFSWVATDGTLVTSASSRGRATVVFFLTTYDLVSQLVARELNDLLHRRSPRFNVIGVVLEAPKYALLVEAFSDSLGLDYPLVLADHATRAGRSPFGRVDGVPAIFVLDRQGRVVWRRMGAVQAPELKEALAKADGGGNASPP